MSQPPTPDRPPSFDPGTITRPDRTLLRYYIVTALFGGPLFPIIVVPLLCKYATLKYRFDDDGVSMSWGVLFRQEIHLTYRRIQDIHLTRGLIQRWMGLATVSIQTASGSAGPEMSIEGILVAEALRDYLYAKMRGARGEPPPQPSPGSDADETAPAATGRDEALVLLGEIRDLLRRMAAGREAQS